MKPPWSSLRKVVAAVRHPPRRGECTHETLCCDFWNWGPEAVRPPCCTAHLQEVLVFVSTLLSARGITHWLDYGTLLGAVRDGAFIPWDDDADMGVLAADRGRILALAPEVKAAGYHLTAARRGEIRIDFSAVNGVGVDLFMWSREGDMLTSAFSDELDWPGTRGATGFPVACVQPPGSVVLNGHRFPAPDPVDDVLRRRYGPDYMTPFRGVRAGSRWCPTLTPEEMTPAAAELFAEISAREPVLLELAYRSRLARLEPWRKYWVSTGLPRRAPRAALAEARARIPQAERTPAVERMIASRVTLEHAIEELVHRPRTLALRRGVRRVRWAGAKARGVIADARS